MFSNGRDVLLEYVKDQWERYLDISVNLQIVEGAVWSARRARHDMPIYLGQYEYDFLDPANMLTRLWRSTSETGSPRHAWRNERFDELVTLAGREIDEPKRISLYQQAERILVEDVGGLFLTQTVTSSNLVSVSDRIRAGQKRQHGFSLSGYFALSDVYPPRR